MPWPSASPALNLALALIAAVALGAAAFYAALPWIVQPMLRLMLKLRYKVIVRGLEHIPREGPALLALNHVSWLDGFVIAAHVPRRGKAMINAALVSGPVLRPIALRAGLIPTPWSGPRAIRAALETTRERLDLGEAVAIFPEGQISRHGMLNPFQRGIEVILKGKESVPVVPGALDGLWGSNFSFSGGHFYRKRPKGLRRTIALVFGPPLPAPVTAVALQRAVQDRLVEAHECLGAAARPLDSIDATLPRWEHPELGLLAASARDVVDEAASVRQVGHKEGAVGLIVPGVALRAVDEAGADVAPGTESRLIARVAGRPGWHDTGRLGAIERDGFVRLAAAEASATSTDAG
jgi:1-acyl-sn-glycerol-3-phosphate acyltransferase